MKRSELLTAGYRTRFVVILFLVATFNFADRSVFAATAQSIKQDLGLDDALCHRLGLRLHKLGVTWPLEPQELRAFATGLRRGPAQGGGSLSPGRGRSGGTEGGPGPR